MTIPEPFAADERAFVEFRRAVARAADLSVRLPDWPFRASTGFTTIFEYGRVLASGFAPVLHSLALAHGDSRVTTIGLQPEPDYFKRDYGFLPGFSLDSATVGEGYGAALTWEPGGDPTGSLIEALDSLAISGSTNLWAIVAQRDWEIGLLLTAEPNGAWLDAGVPWHPSHVDLDTIRSPVGWGMPLSPNDRAKFWSNVRTRGSGQ